MHFVSVTGAIVRLACATWAGWSSPEAWPALQSLNLKLSWNGGVLPANWSKNFKSLETLILTDNGISGTLPAGRLYICIALHAGTGAAGAFGLIVMHAELAYTCC